MNLIILGKESLTANDFTFYNYKIADKIYQSDLKIKILNLLNSQSSEESHQKFKQPDLIGSSLELIFNNKAWIGETQYSVKVESSQASNYCIQCDNQKYFVDKQSINAKLNEVDETILLGPVLILNLAINEVFCLHASSFILNNKIFILMADSGTGKSTIARYMDEQPHCKRLADDILPLKIAQNQLMVLPNFPQLKLSSDQQYKEDSLAKETILLFAEKSDKATSLKPIDTFSTMKKIINHSVATKLFAKNELKTHLSFCHKTSLLVKSYQVKYQHSGDSLQQLYQLLNEHC